MEVRVGAGPPGNATTCVDVIGLAELAEFCTGGFPSKADIFLIDSAAVPIKLNGNRTHMHYLRRIPL